MHSHVICENLEFGVERPAVSLGLLFKRVNISSLEKLSTCLEQRSLRFHRVQEDWTGFVGSWCEGNFCNFLTGESGSLCSRSR